jgi:aspartyl-tRNA(Asn)/glutamyl-tRNA(Gln) amidotransferase subunit B
VLEGGGKVVQETRLYDAEKNETRPMRTKEEANDYRYFPDPDLLPLVVDQAFIDDAARTLPELPDARRDRFMEQYGLSRYDASVLTASRELADYFERATQAAGGEGKLSANWVMGELSGQLNREGREIGESPVSPELLGGMLRRISDGTISGKIAKQVFEAMWNGEGDADSIIADKGLEQITDAAAIEKIVREVVDANPKQVQQYLGGQQKVFGFFVGRVMKATQGKANPVEVNRILKQVLSDAGGAD